MVEVPIHDFLVVIGNDMDAELGTHRVFNVMADPQVRNRRVLFKLQARDVPVRRRGGWYFFNLLLGRRHIVGKVDLSQMRELSVPEDMVLPIKLGKPSVYVVFAERKESLPKAFKDDRRWRMTFDLLYMARANEQALAELYESANLQQTEIQDRLSQSQTMLNDFVIKQMQNFQQALEQGERKKLLDASAQQQQQQQRQQGGFY